MAVHRDYHLVFFSEGSDTLGHGQRGGSGDKARAERFCLIETAINLLIREAVIEAEIVSVDVYTRILELGANAFEIVERHRQTPFAKLFTGSGACGLIR